MAVVLVVDDGAANRELIQAYLSGIRVSNPAGGVRRMSQAM